MPYVTKDRPLMGREHNLAKMDQERTPRPGTRFAYVNRAFTHDPAGEQMVRITLPAEPWHEEGAA